MKFRIRSTDLSHFKALVMFVFAIYGILIPLWFAFHGNKLLGDNDQWQKIVVTSTRVARSGEKSLEHFRRERNGLLGLRHRFKRPPMLPKPIHSFQFWPIPPEPRQKVAYSSGKTTFDEMGTFVLPEYQLLAKVSTVSAAAKQEEIYKKTKVGRKRQIVRTTHCWVVKTAPKRRLFNLHEMSNYM